MLLYRLLFALGFIVCCLTRFANGATLERDEVEALRSIGRTLGKNDWIFDGVDPCSGARGWRDQPLSSYHANNVTCDCSSNNGNNCHVTHILLKAQNLSGTLPTNLDSLPFLQEIDLTRNYLSGNIPAQWGSASRLALISLLGNRLTGEIPEELANLSNLTSLVLEVNQLSGNLPRALGNLSKLERLHLSSNNFTGEIPETYANLTSLEEFRISDNNFMGRIPDFMFRNWRNLTQIYMEASGLSGPIPSITAPLDNLKYIIISDLNGDDAAFPLLDADLPKLDRVMLRSCNLIGQIPPSLGKFATIKILDLSFNRLSGEIPDLSGLNLDTLFLNGNNFTGAVPRWILNSNEEMDVSYNNFTSTGGVSNCGSPSLNFFSSIPRTNNSGIVPCLRNQINCTESVHSVYINCGGRPKTINGTIYEGDVGQAGPSTFLRSDTNWALSNTGVFLNDDRNNDLLTTGNADGELHQNARLSPSSLTYYAFCLANANYTVNLHFAEIQFSDQNYSSLGRRIFDVYIQGQRMLKDFNIKEEAGGSGIQVVKPFAVNVTDGTLEIHLRWAGKGTTSIPVRGVYGPLISAISIFDPAYIPVTPRSDNGGIAVAAVVGIVGGAVFAALLVVGILWWRGCLRRERTLEQDLKGVELQTSSFSLRQIKAATNDFHVSNKIGEGGFGPVYKGTLPDGTVIAVKQLSARSKQGNRDIEDILKEWNEKRKTSSPFQIARFGGFTHKIAGQIKNLREKLSAIEMKNRSCLANSKIVSPRNKESTCYGDLPKLIGRDEIKTKIVSRLADPHEQGTRTISIVGMGGIGKTALAQLIYHDAQLVYKDGQEQKRFDKKIWVHVSKSFDTIKIAQAIILAFNEDDQSDNLAFAKYTQPSVTLQYLLNCIRKTIQEITFFLILDKVWTDNEDEGWEQLQTVLKQGKAGSRILVTTRKVSVAKRMSSDSDWIYHLSNLSESDCWSILDQFTFDGKDQLSKMGRKSLRNISMESKGLPLVAKALGNFLQERPPARRGYLQYRKLCEFKDVWEVVMSSLLLSYLDLPSTIKQCFLYCAIFPRGFRIQTDNLVRYWMAQDILTSDTDVHMEDTGIEFFDHLVSCCLFQEFEKDGDDVIVACKMHDIIYDLVKYLTRRDFVTVELDRFGSPQIPLDIDDARHLTIFLHNSETSGQGRLKLHSLHKLRSLVTFPSMEDRVEITDVQLLRVLELSCYNLWHNYTVGLKYLRHLKLFDCKKIQELPSIICKLHDLLSLDLQQCSGLKDYPMI